MIHHRVAMCVDDYKLSGITLVLEAEQVNREKKRRRGAFLLFCILLLLCSNT